MWRLYFSINLFVSFHFSKGKYLLRTRCEQSFSSSLQLEPETGRVCCSNPFFSDWTCVHIDHLFLCWSKLWIIHSIRGMKSNWSNWRKLQTEKVIYFEGKKCVYRMLKLQLHVFSAHMCNRARETQAHTQTHSCAVLHRVVHLTTIGIRYCVWLNQMCVRFLCMWESQRNKVNKQRREYTICEHSIQTGFSRKNSVLLLNIFLLLFRPYNTYVWMHKCDFFTKHTIYWKCFLFNEFHSHSLKIQMETK